MKTLRYGLLLIAQLGLASLCFADGSADVVSNSTVDAALNNPTVAQRFVAELGNAFEGAKGYGRVGIDGVKAVYHASVDKLGNSCDYIVGNASQVYAEHPIVTISATTGVALIVATLLVSRLFKRKNKVVSAMSDAITLERAKLAEMEKVAAAAQSAFKQ